MKHAFVDLLEQADHAQTVKDSGDADLAKTIVLDAVTRLRMNSQVNAGLRDLVVSIDLGRIRIYIDYADEQGEMTISWRAVRR